MTQVDDLLTNWRATYGELFPHRHPEAMRVDDATLALGVYLTRLIEVTLKTRVIEPAYAQGVEPGPDVRTSAKVRRPE